MLLEIISILILVAAFVIATTAPINLGAILLAATLPIGVWAAGLSTDEVFGGFPVSLLVILVGVTYLFNVAQANGTVQFMLEGAIRLVRGRTRMVPWIMFAVAGLFSAIGAVYSVAIVAPIALQFAARDRGSQTLMGLMVIHGWGAGALSPISVYGVIVNDVMARNDFASEPATLFLIGLAANLAAALIVFFVLRKAISSTISMPTATEAMTAAAVGSSTSAGVGSTGGDAQSGRGETSTDLHSEATEDTAETADAPNAPRLGLENILTMAAIGLLVLLVIAFGMDVGLVAILLAVALGLATWGRHHQDAIAGVPWSVVLLVGGVLTYVSVLQQIGTVDFIGSAVAAMGVPIIATLILAYVGAIVSAFATSSGVLAALIPLGVPLVESSALAPIAVIGVLAVASTIVDISPFSTNGALVVAASTEDVRDRVLRHLLMYAGAVVVAAPLILWATVTLLSLIA